MHTFALVLLRHSPVLQIPVTRNSVVIPLHYGQSLRSERNFSDVFQPTKVLYGFPESAPENKREDKKSFFLFPDYFALLHVTDFDSNRTCANA